MYSPKNKIDPLYSLFNSIKVAEGKRFDVANVPSLFLLKIVQKLDPIPYVRARASSRVLNDFCEENRHQIRIKVRSHSSIFLVNTVKNIEPFCREESSPDLDGIYVLVNYGRFRYDSTLKVRMEKENIPFLRAALSGFYFDEIVLWKKKAANDDKFNITVDHFLEVYNEKKVSILKTRHILGEQVRKCLELWRPKTIRLEDLVFDLSKWIHPQVVKSSSLFGFIFDRSDEPYNFHEAVVKKKSVEIYIDKGHLLFEVYMQQIISDWKAGIFDPVLAKIYFYVSQELYINAWQRHKIDEGVIHLGNFFKIKIKEMYRNGNLGSEMVKITFWSTPLELVNGQKRMRILRMFRYSALNKYTTKYVFSNAIKDGEIDMEIICLLLYEMFDVGPPLDLSSWAQEKTVQRAEDLSIFFAQKWDFIINFYRKR